MARLKEAGQERFKPSDARRNAAVPAASYGSGSLPARGVQTTFGPRTGTVREPAGGDACATQIHARLFGIALLLIISVWPSFAADLPQFQPCWRGQSGSTFQSWSFSATPTNADEFGSYFGPQVDLPDAGGSNLHGTAQALIVANTAGIGWFANDQFISTNLSGIWDLGYGGGSVTLTVPGSVASPGLTRDIWVQVTEATTPDSITITNAVTVIGGTMIGSAQRVTIETHQFGYVWAVSQTLWRVPADSAANTIVITGGCEDCISGGSGANSFVDHVVIDTRVADFSVISPGGNLNTGTQTECTGITLDPGSSYTWELKDATGAAGVGFDRVTVSGTSNINVLATSGNKFTVNLITLNGASAGQAANFNNNNAATWALASATGGSLLGFDPSKFTLSATTSQFQNNLGGGVFSLAQSGDGKSLDLVFTPNHAPTASDAPYTRGAGLTLKVRITDLLAGSTSDPDGNPRALSSVDAVSSQGATVTSDGTYIYYEPVNGNADFFNYTVRDVVTAYRVGEVRTATARVNVSVVNAGGIVQTIQTTNGVAIIHSAGIPEFQYDLERSATVDFTPPVVVVLTTNAPANGRFSYTDNPPTQTAFYRLKQH